jgi:2-keto-3-deoxy-L-rhamnonate aldolase RhmA
MMPRDASAEFRDRLHARQSLVGTWVKTPSPVVCEVLARSGLDLLVLDAEHAPFGRGELDSCLAMCCALGMPALVRVPSRDSAHVLNALDCGATGVLVPHVDSAAAAEDAVRASHYGRGGRGYAGSTRAAGFAGRKIDAQLELAKRSTTVVVQIEDVEALDAIDAIARVPGIDCLFVGRIDLTVSLGRSDPDDPVVVRAVERICEAGKAADVPVGMFVARPSETRTWVERGASFFVLASDQAFLLSGAKQLLAEAR